MRHAFLACVLLGLAATADARTIYAKAAGGNWSDASTWSTVSCVDTDDSGPPTTTDDVLIEACAGVVTLDVLVHDARTVYVAPGATLTAANSGLNKTLGFGLTTTGTMWSADAGATIDTGTTAFLVTARSGQTFTFAGGGQAYGEFRIGETSMPGDVVITGANTFAAIRVLAVSTSGNFTLTLPAGATTTIRDLQVARLATSARLLVASSTPGMAATLSKANGTINVDGMTVTDSAATGGATWCAYDAAADGGGNTGWSFVACPLSPIQLTVGAGR